MAFRRWLEHPKHGRKEAYTLAEYERDKVNGWLDMKKAEPEISERERVMSLLDAEGVKYDRRWGLSKLKAILHDGDRA